MRKIDILNGIAIRCHPLLSVVPTPVLTEHCLEQVRVGTRRNSIDRIVRAHESSHVTADAAFEAGKVILNKVLLRNLRIELVSVVAIPGFDIVASEMLACSDNALVGVGGVPLEILNQGRYIGR